MERINKSCWIHLAEQLYGTLFLGKNSPILFSAFHQCLLLPGRLGLSRSCENLHSRVVCGEEVLVVLEGAVWDFGSELPRG